jgi:hypothetical protein
MVVAPSPVVVEDLSWQIRCNFNKLDLEFKYP